jgi:prepilin-type processing-associated H-X9-DG protein
MPRPDEYDTFDRPPRAKPGGRGLVATIVIVTLVFVVCGGGLIAGLIFTTSGFRDAASRMKSSNNLKQIALGIHNYNDVYGELPANTYGPDGKPLLSWRVHLLPFIEQDNLYHEFKLDDPWDSPNNLRLLNQVPWTYAHPKGRTVAGLSKTYYRGFSSPGAVFEKRLGGNPAGPIVGGPAVALKKDEPFNLAKFKDPRHETILLVEAGDPVEWTKPDDLDASPGKPFPPLGGMQWANKRVNIAFADGSVRAIKQDVPEDILRALVTHSGGEPLPPGWDE